MDFDGNDADSEARDYDSKGIPSFHRSWREVRDSLVELLRLDTAMKMEIYPTGRNPMLDSESETIKTDGATATALGRLVYLYTRNSFISGTNDLSQPGIWAKVLEMEAEKGVGSISESETARRIERLRRVAWILESLSSSSFYDLYKGMMRSHRLSKLLGGAWRWINAEKESESDCDQASGASS